MVRRIDIERFFGGEYGSETQKVNAEEALIAWSEDTNQVILTDGRGRYATGPEDFVKRCWEIVCPEEIEKLLQS